MIIEKGIALWIIFIISIAGLLFSGYLSYSELFRGKCELGTCGGQKLLNVPVCIYGFFMYLIIFVISLLAIIA